MCDMMREGRGDSSCRWGDQQCCDAANASKQFPENEGKPVEFTKMAGYPKGKTCNCKWTEEQLGWSPKYPSFNTYLRRLGGEYIDDPVKEDKEKSSLLWMPGDDEDEWYI